MRNTAITIQINNPCHEDWAKMNPTTAGRFCNQCEKTVVDFTGLTDEEIYKIILSSSSKLCGSFHPNQLNREIRNDLQKKKKNSFSHSAKWLAGLFLVASGGELSAKKIDNHASMPVEWLVNTPAKRAIKKDHTFRGIVLDANTKEPIIGAIVRYLNTDKTIAVTTNYDGLFTLTIPDSLVRDTLDIEIDNFTYIRQYVHISRHELDLPTSKEFLLIPKSVERDTTASRIVAIDQSFLIYKPRTVGDVAVQIKHKAPWWMFWRRRYYYKNY